MESTQLDETLPRPPGVIAALRAGFDAIASHAGVLVLPVLVDLALWLGPRVRLDRLVAPLLPAWSELALEPYSPAEVLASYQQLSANWNLLNALRTFPIGLPSLMSWSNAQQTMTPGAVPPTATPLGTATVWQVGSAGELLLWLAVLTLAGWLLGGLYYAWVARISLGETRGVWTGLGQALLLSLLWALIAGLLALPGMVILGVLALISANLFQLVLFGLAVLAIWIALPVFFSPHAIFASGKNAPGAILESFKMLRPGLNSSLFLLTLIVMAQGFNMLWNVARADTWLMLVGILGHAFIATALLAASFIYYRDTLAWLEKLSAFLKARALARRA